MRKLIAVTLIMMAIVYAMSTVKSMVNSYTTNLNTHLASIDRLAR